MRAAAVGLSPKTRRESALVRGDASTASRRSVRVLTLTSFDESEDDVPGTACGALGLCGVRADGAFAGGVLAPGCVIVPPGGGVAVWATAPATMPSARTSVSVLIARAFMVKPSRDWNESNGDAMNFE